MYVELRGFFKVRGRHRRHFIKQGVLKSLKTLWRSENLIDRATIFKIVRFKSGARWGHVQDNQEVVSPAKWTLSSKWVVGTIAFVLMLASISSVFWIDMFVAAGRRIEGIRGDLYRIIALSEFFAHGFGVVVVIAGMWVLTPQLRRMIPRMASCAILPGLMCQLIKLLVARKRPNSFPVHMADSATETWIGLFPNWELGSQYANQSFPSAHAATAIGMAIGLSWLFPRGRYMFWFLALLACVQRIVSGAHWMSDVFAGACIAIVICFFIFRQGVSGSAFRRLEKTQTEDSESSSIAGDDCEQPRSNVAA